MDNRGGFIYAALVSFAAAFILCPLAIPFLTKLRFGQYVRDDGPQAHLKKAGVPTMGGIVILLGFAVSSLIFSDGGEMPAVLITTALFGLVGFADDYIKVVKKRSLGLKPLYKLACQCLITALFIVYLYLNPTYYFNTAATSVLAPLTGKTLDLGYFYIPFIIIVITGCVNGSNFTDGQDGLNAGVTAFIAAFLIAAAILAGSRLTFTAAAMAGALLGFLAFNAYPAKIIMGDTGSLALGGFVAVTSIILKVPLFLVFAGFIYLINVLSVMIQVGWFKFTKKRYGAGRRVFKMAPLHHHYEQSGYPETKITAAFYIVTVVMCLIAFLGIKY